MTNAFQALDEVTDAELDAILGGGSGVIPTISHECHMNSFQFVFTCCS
uniref:Variacin (Bacteriocin) n=1 Tax=Kocuria varians TaxID=1272 RepID=Q50848_KOCVA|nr:bacteriocin [Kocuria varians]